MGQKIIINDIKRTSTLAKMGQMTRIGILRQKLDCITFLKDWPVNQGRFDSVANTSIFHIFTSIKSEILLGD